MYQCPKCKSSGALVITARSGATVYLDSAGNILDIAGNRDANPHIVWDNDSECRCDYCKKWGTVADFKS